MNLSEQGVKDGLRDLVGIRRLLNDRLRDAEVRLARAEADVEELRKLAAYADQHAKDLAAQLARLTGEPGSAAPAAL